MSATNYTKTAPLLIVTVGDLTVSEDGKSASLIVNGETVSVFTLTFMTVAELVSGVRLDGEEEDMNPWIDGPAYDMGIRVEF